MKIEQEILEDRQVRLKVEVEPEQFESAKRRAARKIAERTKIPGFRPGKAPYNVILRYAGEAAVVQESLEILVEDVYPKAVEESGIEPYGPGELVGVPSSDPPIFEFLIPLEAEVDPGDYRSIRIPYEPKEVSEAQVEEALTSIREQQAIVEPVERAAQEDDQVSVLLSAERQNVEEGQVATMIRERSVTLLVRPDRAPAEGEGEEWPFPGFSRELVGMQAGEEKTITYTFPEESSLQMFRGQTAEYKFKVELVRSRTLPELDDNLAKTQGEYETLAELRAGLREKLEADARREYHQDYDEKILDQLLELANLKYPPQMLENEIDDMIRQLENRLGQQKLDMQAYLKMRQMDMAKLREELKPTAETRLKRFLVMYNIGKIEKVQVSSEEIQTETMQMIEALSRSLPQEQAAQLTNEAVLNNLARDVSIDLLFEKIRERLRLIARGENPPVGEETSAATEAAEEMEETPGTDLTGEETPGVAAPEDEGAGEAAQPEAKTRKKTTKVGKRKVQNEEEK